MEQKLAQASKSKQIILAILTIICCFVIYFILPNTLSEAGKRVTAVLVFAILFWGFEIIPLYATSLIIVLLLTLLLTSPVDILGIGPLGLQYFLTPFSSPIIMLFFGGLILAAAAHRHQVDIYLIEKMLSKLHHNTFSLITGVLFITAFFSMWISNTAATAMMLMLIKPVLDNFEKGDLIKKRMVLAIAFAANIGGIATPIGTPPNAIAIGILNDYGIKISFLEWMAFTVPFVIILLVISALILYLFFPSETKKIPFDLSKKVYLSRGGFTVLIFAVIIIALWLTKPLHHIPESIVALIGISLLAAFGLITVGEIRGIPWDVLILMWGGLALGEAVQKSGMVDTIVAMPIFAQSDLVLIICFSVLALLLTAFISNTATANLLLPIAVNIQPTNSTFIAITVALACSFSFAFPISTPPNALAYGSGLFTVKDMAKSGGIISIIAMVIMLAVVALILL